MSHRIRNLQETLPQAQGGPQKGVSLWVRSWDSSTMINRPSP